MIPISMRESIDFNDKDGTVFKFKPKSASLEREFMMLCYDMQKDGSIEAIDKSCEFFDKIVLGWSGKGLPAFTDKPSQHWNLEERMAIFTMWSECNLLPVTTKKK
jgi:hypothetical protein